MFSPRLLFQMRSLTILGRAGICSLIACFLQASENAQNLISVVQFLIEGIRFAITWLDSYHHISTVWI